MKPLLIAGLAVSLAFPASSAESAPAAAGDACAAAYKGEYQEQWALTRADWTQRCGSGGTAEQVLAKAKADFIAQCLAKAERAEPAKPGGPRPAEETKRRPGQPGAGGLDVDPNDVAPLDPRTLCAQGLPGQKKLEAALAKSGGPGAAGDKDKKAGESEQARAESLGRDGQALDALSAGVGARVKADVAGLYGERTAHLDAGGPGALAAAPSASRRGPLPPPPAESVRQRGLRISDVPTPNSAADLDKRVDRLPYDPTIKSYLHTIVATADGTDARRTVETIERYKPDIKSEFAGPTAYGQAWNDSDGHHIQISPGYVTAKGADTNLPPTRRGYEELAKKDGKAPPVPLAVSDPGNKGRKDLGVVDGEHVYEYPDGSRRHEYSEASQAGTLMHEVQHVRRTGEGGGANNYTDERDAHDIQYRFYTRYEQKHGGAVPLDDFKTEQLRSWQRDPKKFDADLKDRYGPDGNKEITAGEVTPDQQLAAAQRRLKRADDEVGWSDHVYRWVKGKNTKDLDALDEARDEVTRVQNDKKLASEAEKEGAAWRADREKSFRDLLTRKVEDLRAQVDKMPEKTKKQRAAKDAARRKIQDLYDEGMAHPWTYIPHLPVP